MGRPRMGQDLAPGRLDGAARCRGLGLDPAVDLGELARLHVPGLAPAPVALVERVGSRGHGLGPERLVGPARRHLAADGRDDVVLEPDVIHDQQASGLDPQLEASAVTARADLPGPLAPRAKDGADGTPVDDELATPCGRDPTRWTRRGRSDLHRLARLEQQHPHLRCAPRPGAGAEPDDREARQQGDPGPRS